MDGDDLDFEIIASESSFDEMGAEAVQELSYGPGTFEIDGHEHDDGSKCEPLTGLTFSIMATTFDGVEHKLLFTPHQISSMGTEMAKFILGIRDKEEGNEPT